MGSESEYTYSSANISQEEFQTKSHAQVISSSSARKKKHKRNRRECPD
jgi:hypothetical protein